MKGDVNIIMNDLLMYIDRIDQSMNDAEIDVLESMIQSYDKSIMILEGYEGEDFSAFDIFQEGEKWDKFKEDTKAPVFGKKGESVAKRIVMILPRLIQKLAALIQKIFKKNNGITQKMENDIKKLENEANKPMTKEPTKDRNKKSQDNRKDNPSINIKSKEEIDKKKSSTDKFIKDFLDEAGVKVPETPMSEKLLVIKGSTLFWQLDNDDFNFGLISDFYAGAFNKPELGYSQEGDIHKLTEYAKSVNHSIEYIDKKIKSILKGVQDIPSTINIKFGDAIDMMKKMKEIFESTYSRMNNGLKRINAAIPKLKEREKEIEVHFENEVKSDNFNPDTSLTVKESDAMSKYLMALTSLQIKLDTYCQAVLRRWNIDYHKIMTAIEHEETNINLNSN